MRYMHKPNSDDVIELQNGYLRIQAFYDPASAHDYNYKTRNYFRL